MNRGEQMHWVHAKLSKLKNTASLLKVKEINNTTNRQKKKQNKSNTAQSVTSTPLKIQFCFTLILNAVVIS